MNNGFRMILYLEAQRITAAVLTFINAGSVFSAKLRAERRAMIRTPGPPGDGFQLLIGQLIACFLRNGQEFFGRTGGFHGLFLFVGEFAEDPLVYDHDQFLLRLILHFHAHIVY